MQPKRSCQQLAKRFRVKLDDQGGIFPWLQVQRLGDKGNTNKDRDRTEGDGEQAR